MHVNERGHSHRHQNINNTVPTGGCGVHGCNTAGMDGMLRSRRCTLLAHLFDEIWLVMPCQSPDTKCGDDTAVLPGHTRPPKRQNGVTCDVTPKSDDAKLQNTRHTYIGGVVPESIDVVQTVLP